MIAFLEFIEIDIGYISQEIILKRLHLLPNSKRLHSPPIGTNLLLHLLLLLHGLLQQILLARRYSRLIIQILNHILQPLILLPQLPNQPIRQRLVHRRMILNLLDLVGVPQRRQALLVVVVGGRHGADHYGFGVAAEGVLKDAGEAGGAVWHDLVLALPEGFLGEDLDD